MTRGESRNWPVPDGDGLRRESSRANCPSHTSSPRPSEHPFDRAVLDGSPEAAESGSIGSLESNLAIGLKQFSQTPDRPVVGFASRILRPTRHFGDLFIAKAFQQSEVHNESLVRLETRERGIRPLRFLAVLSSVVPSLAAFLAGRAPAKRQPNLFLFLGTVAGAEVPNPFLPAAVQHGAGPLFELDERVPLKLRELLSHADQRVLDQV